MATKKKGSWTTISERTNEWNHVGRPDIWRLVVRKWQGESGR